LTLSGRIDEDLPIGPHASVLEPRALAVFDLRDDEYPDVKADYRAWNGAAKRALDLALSAGALILLIPALLVIAALVKTSSGSVIFSQPRLGLGGRVFRCYKFRTMTVDAETVLHRLLTENSAFNREFEEKAKLTDDPRLTRFGRFLRRSSLDELPQLVNVLRGEMSLVGPRPLVPEEIVRYGTAGGPLLTVKPGITGLWQVSGRNNLSYAERIRIDMRYISDNSVLLDLSIMVRTVGQMFRPGRNGAY
jgi:lipopolysaccharide/colanic/teichoic acid biosynthesis glycosyltransferase